MTTTLKERANAAKCGSTGGYSRHHRLGEEPCAACKRANSDKQTARRVIRRVEEAELPGSVMSGFSIKMYCRSCDGELYMQNLVGPLFRGSEYKIVLRCHSCHISYLVRVLMDDGFGTDTPA